MSLDANECGYEWSDPGDTHRHRCTRPQHGNDDMHQCGQCDGLDGAWRNATRDTEHGGKHGGSSAADPT